MFEHLVLHRWKRCDLLGRGVSLRVGPLSLETLMAGDEDVCSLATVLCSAIPHIKCFLL